MTGGAGDASGARDMAGVGKAAWKLEDAYRGERSVRVYPSQKEARDLYIQAAGAERHFRTGLVFMMILSMLETPSWCNTTEGFFDWMDPTVRCHLKHVTPGDLMLSTVPYIPPGWGVVVECVLMVVILRKLLLERKLQLTYFDPIGATGSAGYINMDMVNFGLCMVAWEMVDCAVFVAFRPSWRLAFISRTGFMCLLPAVQSLFFCLKQAIVEFLSIASFLGGTIIFFAWITATIFDDLKDTVNGVPVNKGFESFSASLYTMFVAGATDDFVSCFLLSYTKYRVVGLLWLFYLIIVQVLLLSLVLDTLVAAYTTYREKFEEDSVRKNVQGIMETFDILIESNCGDAEGKLTKDSFLQFVNEFGRSPRARSIDNTTAEIMFSCVDPSQDGTVSKPEFGKICGVMEYELWTTQKYSWIQKGYPETWNSRSMQWFVEKVEAGPFDACMNFVLLVNLLLVVAETTYDLYDMDTPIFISHLELVFSLIYVVEVGLRLCVYSWPEYWSFRSNQFDFFTTWALLLSSLAETVAEDQPAVGGGSLKRYMNILRLLRLLRVVKQLKQLKVVQFMVDTILKLVLASKDVMMPLGVVVFFFTTLSVQLWGGLLYVSNPHLEESEYAESKYFVLNFNDFLSAFGVWVVALLCEYVPEFAESIHKTASHSWTWCVFFIFYVFAVSIVFELVKAFTIEVFVELTNRKHDHDAAEGEEEEEHELSALVALAATFEEKGESLHYRNIGDVMTQEKMREAFSHIEQNMEHEEEEERKHGHH